MGESLFPADFSEANTILVDPPKTGLIMHHSDCRFVFLFVIRIGDDSGRRKWEAQQGAQAQYRIHKVHDVCKKNRGIICFCLFLRWISFFTYDNFPQVL